MLGSETVLKGGSASSTTVGLRGTQLIQAGGIAGGTVVSDGGRAVVLAGGTLVAASLVGAGTMMLSAGAVDTTSITFVSSGGAVYWGGGGKLAATLAGSAPGDTVDLTALAFAAGSATLAGLVLSVTEGGTTDRLVFATGTGFSGTMFSLASDGRGDTAVTLLSTSAGVLLAGHGGG